MGAQQLVDSPAQTLLLQAEAEADSPKCAVSLPPCLLVRGHPQRTSPRLLLPPGRETRRALEKGGHGRCNSVGAIARFPQTQELQSWKGPYGLEGIPCGESPHLTEEANRGPEGGRTGAMTTGSRGSCPRGCLIPLLVAPLRGQRPVPACSHLHPLSPDPPPVSPGKVVTIPHHGVVMPSGGRESLGGKSSNQTEGLVPGLLLESQLVLWLPHYSPSPEGLCSPEEPSSTLATELGISDLSQGGSCVLISASAALLRWNPSGRQTTGGRLEP